MLHTTRLPGLMTSDAAEIIATRERESVARAKISAAQANREKPARRELDALVRPLAAHLPKALAPSEGQPQVSNEQRAMLREIPPEDLAAAVVRAVIGLPIKSSLDGRPLPSMLGGCQPVVVVHDRRLSVGIFMPRRQRNKAPQYRVVAWRTFADRQGKERASVNLHRDELDPVLSMMQECYRRLPTSIERHSA